MAEVHLGKDLEDHNAGEIIFCTMIDKISDNLVALHLAAIRSLSSMVCRLVL